MLTKKNLAIFGSLLSLMLLAAMFSTLDWQVFFNSIKTIQLSKLIVVCIIISFVIMLHSVRWALIAKVPLKEFKYFWQAANIGYLGNMIYPARAGEVLKIIAIRHFSSLSLGRATSSVIIDRIFDLVILGVFTLMIIFIHHKVDASIANGIMLIVSFIILVSILLVVFVDKVYLYIQKIALKQLWQQRVQKVILHALEGVKLFSNPYSIITVLLLTVVIFALDYCWMWEVMAAFGWELPFEAAMTVGVFLLIGSSLPSAPGYIGIYQVACVLALTLYGIDQNLALAYSIVLHLVSFFIIGIQGILVTMYCGFNLSRQ